jgi:hypothetical protein
VKCGGSRLICEGAGYLPLELDSTHTLHLIAAREERIKHLTQRREDLKAGTVLPLAMRGAAALKWRFTADADAADSRALKAEIAAIGAKIAQAQRSLRTLRELARTRKGDGTLRTRRLHGGLPKVGDLFRPQDGMLYTVEYTQEQPRIAHYGRQHAIRAPHYFCRRAVDGTVRRFLQGTITRALAEQGGSLTSEGRPELKSGRRHTQRSRRHAKPGTASATPATATPSALPGTLPA